MRTLRGRKVSLQLLVVLVALSACTRSGIETGASEIKPVGSLDAPSGVFGDLGRVCGPGSAKGETAQGVYDDKIEVGTIADPGFVGRPGLNREIFDAALVFTRWCNAAGGIQGRQLKVNLRDARVTEYRSRILDACANDFALVGGGGAFDGTGVRDRLECLLPDFAVFVVGAEARDADLLLQVGPTPIDKYPAGDIRWLSQRFPFANDHVGAITAAYPAGILNQSQAEAAARFNGMTIVYSGQYNAIGEPTWVPIAQSLKARGVRGLIWTGEPQNLARLERALLDIDYELDWIRVDPNHYDASFLTEGGEALRNTYMRADFVPFEKATVKSATRQYLNLFQRFLPKGRSHAFLGVQAFSAWLLFARAADACGSDLSRHCLVGRANEIGSKGWTGGGLQSPINVAAGDPPHCFLIIEATAAGFRFPSVERTDGIYNCDTKNVVRIPGAVRSGLRLVDVGREYSDLL
ncbi:MAG: hypothetical protein RLY23_728 [Actinomycetota bacterium]